jgi:hypothetical protein
VTATLGGEAANIPGLELRSIGDIISTLSIFKTNIISLISNGFAPPEKVNPPVPQGSYHHVVIPSPPPHVPHDLSHPIHVTSSPHPGHHNHPHIETQEPRPFPLIDINIPSEVQFVQKPAKPTTTIEPVIPPDFQLKVVNPTDTTNGIVNNKEVESLHAGPQSFVDDERVNAGIEVVGEIAEETVKNIPADLWREDIAAIKTQNRKVRKVKRLKKKKVPGDDPETVTPSDPQIIIE